MLLLAFVYTFYLQLVDFQQLFQSGKLILIDGYLVMHHILILIVLLFAFEIFFAIFSRPLAALAGYGYSKRHL